MTKPLVSVGALMLYEEGRLMVNEPVGRYLPQFAQHEGRLLRTAAHARRRSNAQMTIQDLMRHTAGVTYGNRGSTAFYKNYPSSSDEVAEQMTGAEFLEQLARCRSTSSPGRSGTIASASTCSDSRSKR